MPSLCVVTARVKVFKDLYERVYERTGIKMKGYVAVQKKLLTTMYALWGKNEAFDPQYQQQQYQQQQQSEQTGAKPASDKEAEFSSRHSREEEVVPEEPVKKLALSEQG